MSKKIIIVDDDPQIHNVLTHLLKSRFYCITAVDGKDGIAKIITQRPDLVILDINMPQISGMQILKKMRMGNVKRLHTTPVIMLTGSNDKDNVEQALVWGISGYIVKPFTPENVLAQVRKVFSKNL